MVSVGIGWQSYSGGGEESEWLCHAYFKEIRDLFFMLRSSGFICKIFYKLKNYTDRNSEFLSLIWCIPCKIRWPKSRDFAQNKRGEAQVGGELTVNFWFSHIITTILIIIVTFVMSDVSVLMKIHLHTLIRITQINLSNNILFFNVWNPKCSLPSLPSHIMTSYGGGA